MPYPDNYCSRTAPDGYGDEKESRADRRERIEAALVEAFARVMIDEGVNKMDGPDEEDLAEDISFLTDPMNTDCLHDAMMLALSKRGHK